MQADDGGVLPRHLQPGAGGLDRGEVGVNHHLLRPQDLHHQRPDAVKIGVPGGQHHHPFGFGQGRELLEGPFRVLAQGNLHGPVLRKVVQEAPPPHQHLGLPDDLQGLGGQIRRRHPQAHHLHRNHAATPSLCPCQRVAPSKSSTTAMSWGPGPA